MAIKLRQQKAQEITMIVIGRVAVEEAFAGHAVRLAHRHKGGNHIEYDIGGLIKGIKLCNARYRACHYLTNCRWRQGGAKDSAKRPWWRHE